MKDAITIAAGAAIEEGIERNAIYGATVRDEMDRSSLFWK